MAHALSFRRPKTGIVLSGGGARGAYEVGIVAGILEVLQHEHARRAPFDILCGTSVGAINAAYLASHAHHPDMDVDGLVERWLSLRLEQHLKLDVRGLMEFPRALFRGASQDPSGAPSLLDPGALSELVRESVDWTGLHDNIAAGTVQALAIAALEISTGRTTIFGETAPGQELVDSHDPRRLVVHTRLDERHVLASAALPFLFPPREIDSEYYCDGGVRFNTPIAPAIRAGADRLVVISLLYEEDTAPESVRAHSSKGSYANPIFLIGKLLNALLLDPTRYDLQILERLNHVIETMEEVLTPEQLEAFDRAVARGRNMPYRKLRTLVFRPSRDIGEMAHQHKKKVATEGFSSRLLMRVASAGEVWQSDFLSFLLFDGEFARTLIDLGRLDAVSRADEIIAFFADSALAPPRREAAAL